MSRTTGNEKAQILADTLDKANAKFLDMNKSPSRKVNELDNRGSHFYLALYWAQAMAEQAEDTDLQARFSKLAKVLGDNEAKIIEELNSAQGQSVDIGGYYRPDPKLTEKAMRPSLTMNSALETFS